MLCDTGASKIYVHPDFVSKADYTGKVSIASLANSTKQEAPLALVHLNVDGKTFENVKVAVMNTPFSVLIGQPEQMKVKDPSLAKQWEKVKDLDQEEYFSKEGILYRNWKSPVDPDQEVKQVVVPYSLRHSALQLTHSIPLVWSFRYSKDFR